MQKERVLSAKLATERSNEAFIDDEVERSLIKRAIQRDQGAFATLYLKHVDHIYRYVFHKTSNHLIAEDITQQVFLRAWKAIDNYTPTRAPFRAWLCKITRCLIADHYRARKKCLSIEEVEDCDRIVDKTVDANPERLTESVFNHDLIGQAMLKLSTEKQQIIRLRLIEDWSYEDISKLIMKSEGAIRVILHRAINDLKKMLKRD